MGAPKASAISVLSSDVRFLLSASRCLALRRQWGKCSPHEARRRRRRRGGGTRQQYAENVRARGRGGRKKRTIEKGNHHRCNRYRENRKMCSRGRALSRTRCPHDVTDVKKSQATAEERKKPCRLLRIFPVRDADAEVREFPDCRRFCQ